MTEVATVVEVKLVRLDAALVPVYAIPLSMIVILPDRARKDFPNMAQFAENISARGLINPITVSRRTDGKFTLIAGERRFRAHLMMQKKAVDARVLEELSDLEQRELELDENIHREALTWQEKIDLTAKIHELKQAIAKQKNLPRWTSEQTAAHLDEPVSTVQKEIKLAKKLKERPDIAKRVAHLPKTAAEKEIEKIEISERVERLSASGQLKFSSSLLNLDARLAMATLTDDSVDMILSDPPFGMTSLVSEAGSISRTSMSYTGVLKPSDNLQASDIEPLMHTIFTQALRVLKPGAHAYWFFAYESYHLLTTMAQEIGFNFQPTPLTWFKGRTTSPAGGYLYSPCSEPILFMWKPMSIDDHKGRRMQEPEKTLLQFKPPELRIHPFEKPQDLLKRLISISSVKGETVLDPFAGSGATILAAQALGRNGLGFELDSEHFNIAQNRLTAVAPK